MLQLLASIVVVFIALPLHECAHGLVAKKLGDPTASNMGRLTLNPLAHFDPIGTTALILVGFGWAKPVPINPYYFKNRKNGMALTCAGGAALQLADGDCCTAHIQNLVLFCTGQHVCADFSLRHGADCADQHFAVRL